MKTYYIDNKIPIIRITIAIPEFHSLKTLNKTIKHPKFKIGFKQILDPSEVFISLLK